MEHTPEKQIVVNKKVFKQAHADWTLSLISFVESSFMPILVDPFLVGMTIAHPNKWFRYTIIATVTSVLGGLFGYFLGAVFFDIIGNQLIAFYNAEDIFEETTASMRDGAFWLTLIGAVTPLPYKLVAVVGGVAHINLFVFVFASIIGRFARFFIVAYLSFRFGEFAQKQFNRQMRIVTFAVVVAVGLYIVMSVI